MKTLLTITPEGIPMLSLTAENEAEHYQLPALRAGLNAVGVPVEPWQTGPQQALVIHLAKASR